MLACRVWCSSETPRGITVPRSGRGVTIALRDARHVLEALANDFHWSESALSKYSEEREERMRRLRFVAHLFATLRCEFGPVKGAAQTRDCTHRQRSMAGSTAHVHAGGAVCVIAGGLHAGRERPPARLTDRRPHCFNRAAAGFLISARWTGWNSAGSNSRSGRMPAAAVLPAQGRTPAASHAAPLILDAAHV